jgi:SAM-dependent methyltransferase
MHPSDIDIGRLYSEPEIKLEPANPLPWSSYPTRFTVKREGKIHSGVVSFPHLALLKVIKEGRLRRVMDVGAGDGVEIEIFKFLGADVFSVNADTAPAFKATFVGDYIDCHHERSFDIIWCSHVLEHIRNPGLFLDKIFDELEIGGFLAISVPYSEFNSGQDSFTFGHHNRYNVLLLMYALICAGFDCREASVRVYNGQISAVVKKIGNSITPKMTAACWDGKEIIKYLPLVIAETAMHPSGGSWFPNPIRWDAFYEGGPLIV